MPAGWPALTTTGDLGHAAARRTTSSIADVALHVRDRFLPVVLIVRLEVLSGLVELQPADLRGHRRAVGDVALALLEEILRAFVLVGPRALLEPLCGSIESSNTPPRLHIWPIVHPFRNIFPSTSRANGSDSSCFVREA
jgi:hypothetical protein